MARLDLLALTREGSDARRPASMDRAGRRPARADRKHGFATLALLAGGSLMLAACGSEPQPQPLPTPPAVAVPSVTPSPVTSPTPTPTLTPTPKPTIRLPRITGDNAIAFAPLSDPKDITVAGEVSSSNAWSTSKVLVVLAFIDRVAGGDPDNLTAEQQRLIELALTESDMDALLALRGGIPGGSGAPMTEILRSVGDRETTAPDSNEGSMAWTLRNQIKFLTALQQGKLVSRAASRYVIATMRPVASEAWGLGTVGAKYFKGGWLTPDSETRQMGYLDGYAVAIMTKGVGPAELQIDGDYAHVQQMNQLARTLTKYLRADQLERGR